MDRSIQLCVTGQPLVVRLPGNPVKNFNDIDNRIAAVIRDTVYIDGGYLWWQPGMSDGTLGPLIGDGTRDFALKDITNTDSWKEIPWAWFIYSTSADHFIHLIILAMSSQLYRKLLVGGPPTILDQIM